MGTGVDEMLSWYHVYYGVAAEFKHSFFHDISTIWYCTASGAAQRPQDRVCLQNKEQLQFLCEWTSHCKMEEDGTRTQILQQHHNQPADQQLQQHVQYKYMVLTSLSLSLAAYCYCS